MTCHSVPVRWILLYAPVLYPYLTYLPDTKIKSAAVVEGHHTALAPRLSCTRLPVSRAMDESLLRLFVNADNLMRRWSRTAIAVVTSEDRISTACELWLDMRM